MKGSRSETHFCPTAMELEKLYKKERTLIITQVATDPSEAALNKAKNQVEGLSRYLTQLKLVAKEPKLIFFIKRSRNELTAWYRIIESWSNNFQTFKISLLISELENYLEPLRKPHQAALSSTPHSRAIDDIIDIPKLQTQMARWIFNARSSDQTDINNRTVSNNRKTITAT
ncbi:MAG: hypothetical protein KUG82_05155 [Pseudomonadales bacterium]|nr:hypothetical protein [Pseudomonadales bacterium]